MCRTNCGGLPDKDPSPDLSMIRTIEIEIMRWTRKRISRLRLRLIWSRIDAVRYRFVVLNKTTQLLTISMINNFSKSKKTWNSRGLAWIYRRKASGRGFHNNSYHRPTFHDISGIIPRFLHGGSRSNGA